MAEFLNTTGVSAALDTIINQANEGLTLLSPYLNINPQLKTLLKYKTKEVKSLLIYGKKKISLQEKEWLLTVPSLKVRYCQRLHAKAYLNEQEALITSMNLLKYSQQNNYEMGIRLSKKEDPELFESLQKQIRLIYQDSIEAPIAANPPTEISRRSTPFPRRSAPATGYCIRDRAVIPANPDKPYCPPCFQSWNHYKNPRYQENVCHLCGRENNSTIDKPCCYSCYQKYPHIFELAF